LSVSIASNGTLKRDCIFHAVGDSLIILTDVLRPIQRDVQQQRSGSPEAKVVLCIS
jgi:hypothetical protein